MQSIFLALGANLGEREEHLRQARALLQRAEGVTILAWSPLYETDPVGGPEGQGPYLNAVLAGTTSLAPADLLRLCQEVEAACGRVREQAWGPRTLDIDLLIYGDLVLEAPDLILPHPRLHERRFVLEPLCDLAPDLIHPLLKKSMRRLLADFDQAQRVSRVLESW
ncbi:2-amino-4-hydroxy-6-hydroxymethyldihydropteridine diphosphokinase [Geoalkalibacter halelectricus]|uniref:2-amino-4-hydroxy-6-hydroxymethyldihydropteridine pyrophosphokinase n=1 Tax=Geoalkalibacter halelectricus TaxID=2847045 RepID=A0ABY5ZG91_9BACT|nr:2-amino-4-hydroxy-6-hydroxymethyldihydropteridine diphosphokinase [Geoalkalibacter halelectricus]MDO3377930.1 2-amino-4-hydroxy-6-hydroxymethyldihydropteridine diphosphokinase [Geoalkalibacter halelectricus]UWZ77889.1 2-amino-4-hydroxy-6-hydroxymethyldihydropteridine diphosphokinase [Geoalkalibacter halelectricus]